MRNRTWIVRVAVLIGLLLVAAPTFAQEGAFGLSDDDFTLLQNANDNAVAFAAYSVDFTVTGDISLEGETAQIDLSGAFVLDGAGNSLSLAVQGDLSDGSDTIPVEFEIRIIDDEIYLTAVDPSSGESSGWLGDTTENFNAALTQAFSAAGASSGIDFGENQEALGMMLMPLFMLDPSEFVTITRGDDTDANVATFTVDVAVNEFFGSDQMSELFIALIETAGQNSELDFELPENLTPQMMGAALQIVFSDTSLSVEQFVDIEAELVQQTVVTLDLTIDPASLGAAGDPVGLSFVFDMQFDNFGEAPRIDVPEDAQMGAFANLVSGGELQVETPAPVEPTATETVPTATPTAVPTEEEAPADNSGLPEVQTQIAANQPVEVEFDAAPVSLTYESEGDETVTIVARSTDGDLDTTVELLDVNGNRLAFNDDHNSDREGLERFDSLIEEQDLDEAGTYTIVVDTFSGTGAGSVEVTLETEAADAPEPTATPEDDKGDEGEVVEGTVPDNGDFEYEIDVTEGEILTITARATDNSLDTVLNLLDENGDSVAENDDHGSDDPNLDRYDSRIENYEAESSGTYTINVRGFAGSGGDFELTIVRGEGGDSVEPIPEGSDIQTLTESIDAGDIFTTSIDANAGDVYTITVRALDEDLDTVLAVYDADENFLISNDDHGGSDPDLSFLDSRIERYIIPADGEYLIDVSGYRDAEGEFELTIERVATGAPLDEGDDELFTGEIDSNGTFEQEVELEAGTYVTISVRSLSSNLDPYVTLELDGEVLALNDDHGSQDPALGFYDSRINNFIVEESGTYLIVVNAFEGSGSFVLTVNVKN